MISYTEFNTRCHRKAQIKSMEASFDQESFVHNLKYESMTLYSSGVKGNDQVLVQGLIAMIVKRVVRLLLHMHGLSRLRVVLRNTLVHKDLIIPF